MDEWTHQWHDSDGGLTSDDSSIGVPTGLQWLSGPLFAMAGRKSSTQSLVSAQGINFYVTQNVLENVGRSEMPQFLVARDAFNGLVLWQRPWTGTFVEGNGETNPRMVVGRNRLFVAGDSSVQAIEMSTGELLESAPLPRSPDKLAFAYDKLFVQSAAGIAVFDRDLKSPVWEFEATRMSAMVIVEDHVLALVFGRSSDGRFQHDLVCLDPETGQPKWRENTQEQVEAAIVRINFAEDGLVALQAHGSLHVYSTEQGEHLWSTETEARPGKTYVDERFVGHFYRRGLVWLLKENSPREPMGQNLWVGLNARTGKPERELRTKGAWPETATPAKMGCQLLIASDRYIMIPRQSTFIDFESGEKLPFKFTRGGCGLGFVPANGLVYSHPHACGCFSEAIRGFMGMHSDPPLEGRVDPERRLEQGPAYGQIQLTGDAKVDWPMHRQNVSRSGYAKTSVASATSMAWSVEIAKPNPSPSQKGWKLRIGNATTAATIDREVVYCTDVDRGIVKALDIATGDLKWSYSASGRVNTSPTIYRGLCLFGSHDGYVYCLDAATGALAWRFRAAPVERRMMAFGSVESTWPTAGTVLIHDGLAYAAAGRAPDADGGIHVHAFDPVTGITKWSAHVSGLGFNGLCDFLVADQDGVYLSNWAFDPVTGENEVAAPSTDYLRGGKVGLLEGSWTKHDLATRKEIQTWTANGQSGQLLAFTPQDTFAYHADERALTCSGSRDWRIELDAPAQLTGLAVTNDQVIIAGGIDRAHALAGGWLKVLDAKDGTEVLSKKLTAESVFDGISLSSGRIFVATQDGRLHCFAASEQ